ncbi:MAG: type VII secretion integral membrane protein EccD, partial [Cellulomonadaceae bacterium]|nr:type VII secretion integral membrane protein EccD [Cellulomonadaceae bacterium]
MTQPAVAARALLHLSIRADDRKVDLGVPAQLPLVEMLPGVVRRLGLLDPTLVHAGYVLRRADGTDLDPAASCAAQGVRDGEVLSLVRGGQLAERTRYDDVVEAVIDAAAERRGWSPRDQARTALAVSLALLALGAGMLVGSPHGWSVATVVASATALALLVAAAVLTRVDQVEAGQGLGLAAAGYAAVAGFLLVPAGALWSWPLAAAGLAAMVVGGLALAVTAESPQVHLVPVAAGGALATAAAVTGLVGGDGVPAYAVMVALLATASNAAPWLALASTQLAVVSPRSDAEVLADPQPLDGGEIARRADDGRRVLLSLRLAFGVAMLVATPLVATSGKAGALLCVLAYVGMMLQSRQVHAKGGVLAMMATGTAGVALTGITVGV